LRRQGSGWSANDMGGNARMFLRAGDLLLNLVDLNDHPDLVALANHNISMLNNTTVDNNVNNVNVHNLPPPAAVVNLPTVASPQRSPAAAPRREQYGLSPYRAQPVRLELLLLLLLYLFLFHICVHLLVCSQKSVMEG
jgi:hypothetical protein